MVLLAILLGAALVAGVDRALPGIYELEVIPFEVPLGTITPEPPETSVLAQLVVLHLLVAVAGGAIGAVIAPRGRKMVAAAGVAFVGSLAAGYTGVFAPVGPDWYHALHFAAVLIGPCIGGNLVNRGHPEPEPVPVVADALAPEHPPEDAPEPAPEAPDEEAASSATEEAEEDEEPALDGPGPLPEPA